MKIEITDEMVGRALNAVSSTPWHWSQLDPMRKALEAALNPERRFSDTPREDRRAKPMFWVGVPIYPDKEQGVEGRAPTPTEIHVSEAMLRAAFASWVSLTDNPGCRSAYGDSVAAASYRAMHSKRLEEEATFHVKRS